MSTQFVSCSDEKCPMNAERQCRSPFITVGKDGRCEIRNNGPYWNKSTVEAYVDLTECQCEKCDHWEKDTVTGKGKCGFAADLFFGNNNICNVFERTIGQPGYNTVV